MVGIMVISTHRSMQRDGWTSHDNYVKVDSLKEAYNEYNKELGQGAHMAHIAIVMDSTDYDSLIGQEQVSELITAHTVKEKLKYGISPATSVDRTWWLTQVESEMDRRYHLPISEWIESVQPNEHNEMEPEGWVEWYAAKYDLIEHLI